MENELKKSISTCPQPYGQIEAVNNTFFIFFLVLTMNIQIIGTSTSLILCNTFTITQAQCH
jgi:hypothetical protein